MWRKHIAFTLVVCVLPFLFLQCKFSRVKQQELSRVDSLTRDSTKRAYNPYKAGQGTSTYDQQREQLGNLDSLVTPR
jgi:hypothetical protein